MATLLVTMDQQNLELMKQFVELQQENITQEARTKWSAEHVPG